MGVIDDLKRHILVDGFHVVVDTEKSDGSWVVDKETGKKYLDCYSQFASQALGWNHPSLNQHEAFLGKIALHKIANSDMYSECYRDFVDSFASVACPEFSHFFFISGGALGVENALKAAFDWKMRKNPTVDAGGLDVIHFRQAFHGRTGYTMSMTNNGGPSHLNVKVMSYPQFAWSRVTNPKIHFPMDIHKVKNLEKMAIQEIAATLSSRTVAAIIIEPIQGEGGDNHFRGEFLKELRDMCDQHEALLIFDEVQTGFGLTGRWWCHEHFGVTPDILCFGKKTQVCGIAATSRIDEVPDNVFKVSSRINSTWGGNIVDMARCKIIMEIMQQEGLVQNAAVVGDKFLKVFQELHSKYPHKIENPRGRGLMLAFDCPTQQDRDDLYGKLMENMLVLKCGEKGIRFRPHLTFREHDVDCAKTFIEDSLKA